MEKNRIRPIVDTKVMRMSYSRQKEVLEMPNLIEVQKDSYQWFLDEGLKEVFDDISPIADYSGSLSLEFVDFELCKNDVKYSIEECKERDVDYSVRFTVKARLINKATGDTINESEIFMGNFPMMTDGGTFIINGAERVIVSQLVRSPSVYFSREIDKNGRPCISSQIIPTRGTWLEFETDARDVLYVRIDRTRKVPITTLLRAFGLSSDEDILAIILKTGSRKYNVKEIALKVLETFGDLSNLKDVGINSLMQMEISMDKYKTSEMGKALKKVFRDEMTIEDSVDLARKEIQEVFTKKDVAIEKDTDIGFYGDVVGKCPMCGNEVIKNRYAYGCRDYQNCKFRISTQICGRWISKSNVEKLLSEGVTSNIEGFVSKNGKNFNAKLKLDEEKKVVFDFSN